MKPVHDAVCIVRAKHLGAPVLTGDRKMPAHPTFPSGSSTSPNASTRPGADEPPRCGQPGDDVSVVEAEKLSPSDRRGRSV